MQKIIATITLLAGAISAYSQGEVIFGAYAENLHIAVFNTQSIAISTYAVTYAGSTVYEEVGITSSPMEKPQGTASYIGSGLAGTTSATH
jgi:hypothetical protein